MNTGRPDRSEPRLVTVSRRAFLGRAAALGAAAAVPGLACGHDDRSAFLDAEPVDLGATAPATTTTSPAATTTTVSTTTATASVDAPTASSTTATTTAATTTSPAPDVIDGELVVSFTYRNDGSGQGDHRPYIAVWIETADGELVDTISLWFLQSQRGTRWLDDLSRWYSASAGGSDTTMSSATRAAGSYSVAWDGTALSGAPVTPGDYVLFIEAAREDGPYSLTSTVITLSDAPVSATLPNDVELLDARADWTA